MKKIVLNLFVLLFFNNFLFAMCDNFQNYSSPYKGTKSLEISDGILIGKAISGKYVVTIDKNEIIDIIEKQWSALGYKYELEKV